MHPVQRAPAPSCSADAECGRMTAVASEVTGRNKMQRVQFLCRLGLVLISSFCLNDALGAEEDKPPQTGRMVHYSGRVQGVGFRLGTTAIARKYAVTGWVKNLKDGRVQLLAEGSEDEVKKFLAA